LRARQRRALDRASLLDRALDLARIGRLDEVVVEAGVGSALLVANAENVRQALQRVRAILEDVDRALDAGDIAALKGILERAAQARRGLG